MNLNHSSKVSHDFIVLFLHDFLENQVFLLFPCLLSTVNPLLSPPGGLFFQALLTGGLIERGGLKERGGLIERGLI